MGFFGKIFGGTVGFMIGGPIGAVAGAALGHGFIDQNSDDTYFVECPYCHKSVGVQHEGNYNCPHCNDIFTYGDGPSIEEQNQFIFFVCTFSLLAKLAKADGNVSKEEIATIDEFMKNVMNLEGESLQAARNVFREAKHSNDSYRDFAKQFHSIFGNNPEMLATMTQILLQVAVTDGEFHKNEEYMIKDVANIFGFNIKEFEAMKSLFVEDKNKYYSILGCSKSDSIVTIKTKYRQLVKDYHPDKICSKGLPDDFITFAETRFHEIQTAYEFVTKDKQRNN